MHFILTTTFLWFQVPNPCSDFSVGSVATFSCAAELYSGLACPQSPVHLSSQLAPGYWDGWLFAEEAHWSCEQVQQYWKILVLVGPLWLHFYCNEIIMNGV